MLSAGNGAHLQGAHGGWVLEGRSPGLVAEEAGGLELCCPSI